MVARGSELQVAELEQLASARLPEYMVPAAFVRLDAFPMTPNRKVDRKALPVPPSAQAEGTVAPRDDVELVVSSVWG